MVNDEVKEEINNNLKEIEEREQRIKRLEKEIRKHDIKVLLIISLILLVISLLVITLYKYTFFKIILLIIILIAVLILYFKKSSLLTESSKVSNSFNSDKDKFMTYYEKELEEKIKIERLKDRNFVLEDYIYNCNLLKDLKEEEIYELIKKIEKEEEIKEEEKINISSKKDNTALEKDVDKLSDEKVVNNEFNNIDNKKKETKEIIKSGILTSAATTSSVLIASSVVPMAPAVIGSTLIASAVVGSLIKRNTIKKNNNIKRNAIRKLNISPSNRSNDIINSNIRRRTKLITKKRALNNIISKRNNNVFNNNRSYKKNNRPKINNSMCKNLNVIRKPPIQTMIVRTSVTYGVLRTIPIVAPVVIGASIGRTLVRKK